MWLWVTAHTKGSEPGASPLSPPLQWPTLTGGAAGATLKAGLGSLADPWHLHPPPPPRVPSRLLAQGLAHPCGRTRDFGTGDACAWHMLFSPAGLTPGWWAHGATGAGELAPSWRGERAASLHPAMPQRTPSPSSSSPVVTKGLFILWAVPGQGARPPPPPTLQQIQALVRHMAEDAQELFDFYVSTLPWGEGSLQSLLQGHVGLGAGRVVLLLLLSHIPDLPLAIPGQEKDQRLAINNICRTNHPPEWLRGPGTGPGVLQGLRGTMTRMSQALQDITRHQRDLNPPGAEILRRLARTHLKVRGLLSNLKGLFPASNPRPGRRPPPGPTASTKVFQQKLEGCRILWSYARFMAKLNSQLEARSRRELRGKQRSHWGSRLPVRS